MDDTLYYRVKNISIEEEIYDLKKMLRSLEHIVCRPNHCHYELHKRAQANYQRRLDELIRKRDGSEDRKRDDRTRL